MRRKILIQLFIFISIILTSYSIFELYFKKNKLPKLVNEKQIIELTDQNKIKDIKYESTDKLGRKYMIMAKSGMIDKNISNLIDLNNVKAEIVLVDGSKILISSDLAKYNNLNNDTYFKKNIRLIYNEQLLTADNLNILFDKNLLEAFNNLTYKNSDLSLKADKIEINIKTKNSKIFNFDDEKVVVENLN